MAGHFLLSKKARGISGSKMLLLSKERVIKFLAKLDWQTMEESLFAPNTETIRKIIFKNN